MVETMVAEFDRFLADGGVVMTQEPGGSRRYDHDGRAWRLWWVRSSDAPPRAEPGDTRLTEARLPAPAPLAPPMTLTPEQLAALEVIGANPVTLLHGVIA